MSKQKKSKTDNKALWLKVFGINLMLLILAGMLDRIFYIKFLRQNGYDLKEVFVPWQMLFEYHLSGIGLYLAIAMCVPIMLSVLFFWGLFYNKKKDDIA